MSSRSIKDNLSKRFFTLESWRRRLSRRIQPWCRLNWSPQVAEVRKAPCIAVITVNYNTKHLLARLIFSLKRVTDGKTSLGPIIVVDNNSTDGSVELIRYLDGKGVVSGIFNTKQSYHGPGLNQAMAFLLKRRRAGDPKFTDIDYVFVVDSDVIITKGEVFDVCLEALAASDSCMVGEFEENPYIDGGYAHICSLLFDPTKAWRRGLMPFEEHGAPALAFQQSVIRHGLTRLHYPLRSEFFLIHLWSGTLKAICTANEQHNRYFSWASADLAIRENVDRDTTLILEEFEAVFQHEVGHLDPSLLAQACLNPTRIRLSRPYEIAPPILQRQISLKPGPGLVFWTASPHLSKDPKRKPKP